MGIRILPDVGSLRRFGTARSWDLVVVLFRGGMGVGNIILAGGTLAGGDPLAAHFEPSFFSTALRLLPSDFTASLTSDFEAPVLPASYFTSWSWAPATFDRSCLVFGILASLGLVAFLTRRKIERFNAAGTAARRVR